MSYANQVEMPRSGLGSIAAPKEARELPQVMAELDAVSSKLLETFKCVEDRFSPVLRPDRPTPATGSPLNQKDICFGSPLAQAIDEQVRKLQSLGNSLEELVSRSQL